MGLSKTAYSLSGFQRSLYCHDRARRYGPNTDSKWYGYTCLRNGQINAPVVTEITKIHLTNGAEVEPCGLKILELDQEFTRLEYDKLNDELSLRKNNIDKVKLLYDKELRELDLKNQIKGLEINEMDAQLKSQIRLKNVGGAAEEDIEKVKLKLSIMAIEKKMLENELTYRSIRN